MLPYCLKCKKNLKRKDPKVSKTKNKNIMLSSMCEECNSKNQDLSKSKRQADC